MRIIVNADDCGMSQLVDEHIEQAILRGKITSTTVIANMEDLEGAKKLYNQYHELISFGIHLNLTQGTPLRYSQSLLDCGFYIKEEDKIVFNGNSFRRRFLNKACREDILKELLAQTEVLLDNQFSISHVDSHHHIHTALFMVGILPRFSNAIKVYTVRNMWNFMPFSVNKTIRDLWRMSQRIQSRKLKMTDYMCAYADFLKNKEKVRPSQNSVIELMCHPGHVKYSEEEKQLLENNLEERYNCKLISYNLF